MANLKLTYDQFELRIPRVFRDERLSFLDNVDKRIDEIHSQVETTEEQEEGEVNEQGSSAEASQTSSKETVDSDLNAATFMYSEQQSMPLRLPQITDEDIQKGLAIKFIQKHIRAANDRKVVNECMDVI